MSVAARSFEEAVDQALAKARRTLLEEHEKQLSSRGAAWAARDSGSDASSSGVAVKTRASVGTGSQQTGRLLRRSKSRDLFLQSRAELEEEAEKNPHKRKTPIMMRRRSLSSASFKTLHAIIEAATSGGTKAEWSRTTWRSIAERIWDVLRKSFWDGLMALVIILNTVTIGLSTDIAPDWSGWFVIDAIFAAIFLVEMLAKVCRKNGIRLYFLGSGWRWNIFEFALVILAVLEVATGLESQGSEADTSSSIFVFRLFRLARIARILRMSRLSVFSDLLMMINGATGGMRTFLWSVLLISLPLYSVALVLTDSLKDHPSIPGSEMFSNVGTSFFTVFRCMVGNDCTDSEGRPIFVLITQRHSAVFGLIYCVAMLVMTFGLFNVIVAIYVENIVAAAKFNDAHSKRQRLRDAELFTEKITQLVEFIWRKHLSRAEVFGETQCPVDEVAQLEITPDFLVDLRSHAEFQEILGDLDVADEDQLDLFDTLDVDGGGTIDLEELVTGIAKLRGDARRSDIVSVGLVVRSVQLTMQELESKVIRELKTHSEAIRALEMQALADRKTDRSHHNHHNHRPPAPAPHSRPELAPRAASKPPMAAIGDAEDVDPSTT